MTDANVTPFITELVLSLKEVSLKLRESFTLSGDSTKARDTSLVHAALFGLLDTVPGVNRRVADAFVRGEISASEIYLTYAGFTEHVAYVVASLHELDRVTDRKFSDRQFSNFLSEFIDTVRDLVTYTENA